MKISNELQALVQSSSSENVGDEKDEFLALDYLSEDVVDEVKTALELLREDEVLLGLPRDFCIDILNTVTYHHAPEGAAHLLSNLKSAGLLDANYAQAESNLILVGESYDPYQASILFGLLTRKQLNADHASAQDNFLQISRYPGENLLQLKNKVLERIELCDDGHYPFTQAIFEEEVNDGYKQRVGNRNDIKSLADDPESSIRPLTQVEEKRLEKVCEYYAPVLADLGGEEACLKQLWLNIVERYHQKPIYLELGDYGNKKMSMRLPIEWDDFISYVPEYYHQRALLAYYAHPIHGAYRFFTELIADKPSPWGVDHNWQSLTRYKNLLAILWCAASDDQWDNLPNSVKKEDRQVFFLETFSDQQRAHNRDKRRERKLSNHKTIIEYYDDGMPDLRGCYSGFKSRAFDAVLDHPMLTGPSVEKVRYHLKKFVYHQFKNKITSENQSNLEQAWKEITDLTANNETINELKLLNISKKSQKKFVRSLYEIFVDFKDFPELIKMAREAFKLDTNFPTHAHRFGGEIELHKMLENHSLLESPSKEAKLNLFKHSFLSNPQLPPDSDTPVQYSHLPRLSLG